MKPPTDAPHLSRAEELARALVRYWPFRRGTERLIRACRPLYARYELTGVIGRLDGARFYYPPDLIGSPSFWRRSTSTVERVLRRLLDRETAFVDIGADIGWYAAWALDKCARVIACEPSPEAAAILKALVMLNPVANLRVEEAAVATWEGFARLRSRNLEVRTVSLDRLFTKYSVSNRVVCRIDAPGAEVDILGSSRTALASVAALVIEHIGGAGERERHAGACVELLRRQGLSVRVIAPHGVRAWTEADAQQRGDLLAQR